MYLLLVSVVLLLWYLLFRYKRRRLYQLAEPIPGAKDIFPYLGLLKYSYNALDRLTNPADTEYVSKNCLEKDLLIMKSVRAMGDGGVFAPVSIWSRRRKVTISAFSPKILNSFMDIFSRRCADLVDKLKDLSGTGTFDIWPIINNFTLASIAETSLGIRNLDGMNDVAVSDFLKSVEVVFKLVTNRTFSVWLWPDWIYKLSWQYRHFTKHNDKIKNLTNNIIRKKRNDLKHVDLDAYENQTVFGQDDKVDSFLDHLILLSQRQNGFTDTELLEEITTFLLAATDTSAVAICNTLLLLGKYPKIQEKVHEELVRVFENANEKLFKDVLSDLKYLDMVLKESLRLYPPVPMIIRKVTEEIKLPSSGFTIPVQTAIIILIWGAHRDPNYWGPDADCFKPERFEAGGKTGLFIPFSTGPRNCIGYQYAMLTAKSVIAAILRQFKVVTEEEDGPIPKIECKFSLMLKAKHGYPIRLELR
ncbi:cytochrome P450 4C1-like [Leptidea sinapis]|uniref:cytochrome P450 4C1-like n=1 Tax=Leptidea sinapis TaxID=189913 RepID=UPI0021C2C185|nr:cytochrome P450 4C1-like [Leptidea sinapis]